MKKQDMPLVSVLLPLYNEPIDFAKLAIESILHQTYTNMEILLLIDNPHNTKLIDLASHYKQNDARIKVIKNPRNMGLPNTLNRGIELATGEYIARMDGDDISVSTRIREQVDYLQSHPEIDLVGSDADIIDENNKIIGRYCKLNSDWGQKMMLKHAAINLIHPTWIGKAKMFELLKYRNFAIAEDYDFMLRAMFFGYKFHNLPQILLQYRTVQKKIISSSNTNAFIQFKNAQRARKQYKIACKLKAYPDLPCLEYEDKDIRAFQNAITFLNKLRTEYFQKHYLTCLFLTIKICSIDSRPIIFRIKTLIWKSALKFCEKVLLIK